MEVFIYYLSQAAFSFLFFMLLFLFSISPPKERSFPLKITMCLSLSISAMAIGIDFITQEYIHPSKEDIFIIEGTLLACCIVLLLLKKLLKNDSLGLIYMGILFVVGILICNDVFNIFYKAALA